MNKGKTPMTALDISDILADHDYSFLAVKDGFLLKHHNHVVDRFSTLSQLVGWTVTHLM